MHDPHTPTHTHRVKIAAVILLALGCYAVGQFVDFGDILKPDRLTGLLLSTGPFAPIVLILLMATSVVISPIPSLPLDLAAGIIFGPVLGTTYAVIGGLIGAILSFLIGRALGREALSKLLRVDVVFCEKCSDHHLVAFVILARLLPVFSFDLISYGAGLTNMSLKTFTLATLVGMIPPTYAITYFGSSIVSSQWTLVIAGVVMVAFFLFAPKLLMRYRTSWFARLCLGEPPEPAAARPTEDMGPRCPACGGPMEATTYHVPLTPVAAYSSGR